MKFKVNDVELGQKLPLAKSDDEWQGYNSSWANLNLDGKKPKKYGRKETQKLNKIEQACAPPENAVKFGFDRKNLLVEAAMTAFDRHYPLRLTPDVIWITIMQGFANHVDKHAEQLRSKFVAHDGKKDIIVRRDTFVKGSANNWPGVFPEFCQKISDNLLDPKLAENLETNFSTTTDTDRVVGQIALMDTMKNYFEFFSITCCGIPSIELAGEKADWELLRQKAEYLRGFKTEFWMPHLTYVLDRFVDAFDGIIDVKFWESIAILRGPSMSGGDATLTGWLQDLFPYTSKGSSHHLGSWKNDKGDGVAYHDVPLSVSMAPFKWLYYKQEFSMTFVGAIGAVVQDPDTLTVEPVTCWGILENAE